jgi:hypothetical protein
VRLLFILIFTLCYGWVNAQQNELDAQYTPPGKSKFSPSKARLSNTGFFTNASEAPFLWAVKYDLIKAFRNHHQLGFEMSVNDWLSLEPSLGVLTKPTEMYFSEDNSFPLLYDFALNFNRQPATSLNYGSLLAIAVPRNNSILSMGFQVNLFSNNDRSYENPAYMLSLGYQFQYMAYSVGATVDGDAFLEDSREGYLRRQQVTIFLGSQLALGDRLPFILETGAVLGFNYLTAPTFAGTQIPNNSFNYTYQKLEYATAMIPSISFRVRVGMGFNP